MSSLTTGGPSSWNVVWWRAQRVSAESSAVLGLSLTAAPTYSLWCSLGIVRPTLLDFGGYPDARMGADPKDALMDDAEALAALYRESAEEDLFLAQLGTARYAELLRWEEMRA